MRSFSRWLTRETPGENAGDTSSMRALETSRAETSNGELSSRVAWPRTGSPSYTGRQSVRRVHTRLSRSRVNSVADGSVELGRHDCCDSFEALEMEDDIFGGREEGVKLNELFPLSQDFCLSSRSFGR